MAFILGMKGRSAKGVRPYTIWKVDQEGQRRVGYNLSMSML